MNKSGLIFALFLGILTSLFGNLSHGAWWQILALAIFWRHIHQHQFHGLMHQAKLGWVFGLGYFCHGLWWLYISLHDIGGMPFAMAVGAVILLAGFLALFPTVAVWLGSNFQHQSLAALVWAASWTITEWLRGNILTGFPWIGFGDAQINGPFAGLIPIFGVLGACFASLWAAYKIGTAPSRLFLPLFSLAFAVFICSFFEGVSYTTPVGKLLEVKLIQGNFPQTLTYNRAALEAQDEFYRTAFINKPTELVVAPETALSIPENQLDPNWDESLKAFVKAQTTTVLTGFIGFENQRYANQAIGYSPNGEVYRYTKAHLVPFGEYIPKGFEWFVRAIQAPLSQFEKGHFDQPLFVIRRPGETEINSALMICYEDAFGSEIAERIRNNPKATNLLINMTNLAWFGNTSAPLQQLRLAQLRSLETGLPTIRSTNTGVTAIINDHGQVVSKLPLFEQATLTGSVQARVGATPYVKYGDTPIMFVSILILFFAWSQKRATKNKGTFPSSR